MIDFYIIKVKPDVPEYDPSDDVVYTSLGEAFESIKTLSKDNDTPLDNYYVVHVIATDKEEIAACIGYAGHRHKYCITKYVLVNTYEVFPLD